MICWLCEKEFDPAEKLHAHKEEMCPACEQRSYQSIMCELKPWQMTREVFATQKRHRAECRQLAAEEAKERKRLAAETGWPVGHVHGYIEGMAEAEPLENVDHKREVLAAWAKGKPVPLPVREEFGLDALPRGLWADIEAR